MHDIDRTQLEMGWETDGFGAGEFEFEEPFLETSDEMYEEPYGELEGEADFEGPLNEADEMELAAELLETVDEAELDQFLGKVFKKVSRALPASVRRSLGGALRNLAKKYLPIAGAALGNLIAPGIGGALGGNLASLAGQKFGLELEGLSPEDQEFEVARRVVRVAGEAARQAASAPAGAQPQAVAQRALAIAAQRHAPGLMGGARAGRRRTSGVWRRQGNVIVLYGV